MITLSDFRRDGICADARHWFAANGLDWREFVKNGIHPDALRATGQYLNRIDRLERYARERNG